MTGALPTQDELMEMGGGADLSPWMADPMNGVGQVRDVAYREYGDQYGDPSTMQGPLPPPSALSPETRKILMDQIQRLSRPPERKRSMWTDPAFLAGMTLLGGGKMDKAAMMASQAEGRREQTDELGETRRATALASLTGQLSRGDQMAAAAGAKTAGAQQKALTAALSLVAPTHRGAMYKAITAEGLDATNPGALYSFINDRGLKLAPNLKSVAGVGLVDVSGDQPRVVMAAQRQGEADPSNVREWQHFQKLTPEQQQQYLTMKRANPFLDLGDSKVLPNQANPSGPPVAAFNMGVAPQTKVDGGTAITIPAVPSSQQGAPQIAPPVAGQPPVASDPAQPETAPAQAQPQRPASVDLPLTREQREKKQQGVVQVDQMLSTINGILDDPALPKATGMFSWLGHVPGTPQRRFAARAKQLEGQAFLQAYESLKGGGAISEPEGAKATQAIGRLDRSQGPDDYAAALRELRDVIKGVRDRMVTQGGGLPATQGRTPLPGNAEDMAKLSNDEVLKRLGVR